MFNKKLNQAAYDSLAERDNNNNNNFMLIIIIIIYKVI